MFVYRRVTWIPQKLPRFNRSDPFFQVVAAFTLRGSQVRPGFRFAFDLEGLGAPSRGLCLEIRQRCEPMATLKV